MSEWTTVNFGTDLITISHSDNEYQERLPKPDFKFNNRTFAQLEGRTWQVSLSGLAKIIEMSEYYDYHCE